MDANLKKQWDRASTSRFEPSQPMLFSFGDDLSMEAASEVSIARYFVMNPHGDHPTLLDRLMPSLISSGLVRGIIPLSIRRLSLAEIQAIASCGPDGDVVGRPKADY